MNEKTNKTVIEYTKPPEKQHTNTLAAIAATLAGGGAALAIGNSVGGTFSRYMTNLANSVSGGGTPLAVGPAVIPVGAPAVGGSVIETVGGGYVTKEELRLIEKAAANAKEDGRTISEQAGEIARLKAENYADKAVQEAVDKIRTKYDNEVAVLNNKVCNLETHATVTATGFEDYKHFANRLFIHQPKARINERIIACADPCCCTCGNSGNSGGQGAQ